MFSVRSLFGRLMSLYLLIVIGILTLLGVSLNRMLSEYFLQAKEQELISRGTTISQLAQPLFATSSTRESTERTLASAGRLLVGGALIVDREGRVVATIGRRPKQELNTQVPCPITQQLPELLRALDGQVVTRTGYSQVFRESALFAAVPITKNGRIVGATIMHSPVLGLSGTLAHVRALVFGSALAGIILSVLFGYFMARRVTGPLKQMSAGAAQMSAGNFEVRLPERSHDEVGQLAVALNRLSSSLRETVQALSEEKSKLDHIVATMGEGVVAVNRSGAVIALNPKAERMLGVREADFAGTTLRERLPLLADGYGRAMSEGESTVVEWESETAVLRALISPTKVEGSTVGAVAVIQDITASLRIEHMRRQFVADASHQLRAPLTTMLGYAEALLDDVAPDVATRHRYLAIIAEDAKRLNQLIEQLLDLSHIESGQAKMTLEPVSLPQLLHRIVAAIPRSSEEAAVSLDIANDLPMARADTAYTEQVLLNLIQNALQHTPPGGKIRVWAREDAGQLVVGVSDTGCGIAPEHLLHIWQRFYRAAENNAVGTGLGLAIVKSLVEHQGGQVSVESQLHRGSTFSFTLSRAD
jgi:two-component system, OmpR family, sensor histidine kinase ResE